MNQFRAISVDDVITAVHHLSDKSSAVDPLPTYFIKQVADLVAPYIAELFSCSLAVGHFPSAFKQASITPVQKKPGSVEVTGASCGPSIVQLPDICRLTPDTAVWISALSFDGNCHPASDV